MVEDDRDVAFALCLLLEHAGYEFSSCPNGNSSLRSAYAQQPDLVILDIGRPGMEGWSLLRRFREITNVPILILSAPCPDTEKARGLRAGADDYMTKPFSNNELLARVEALLRRGNRTRPAADGDRGLYVDSAVRINQRTRSVFVTPGTSEREVHLTKIEYRLLNALVDHAGTVLTARQLLSLAWDMSGDLDSARVKFAVSRLRRKAGWQGKPSPLRTVRGVGYRYVVPSERLALKANNATAP